MFKEKLLIGIVLVSIVLLSTAKSIKYLLDL